MPLLTEVFRIVEAGGGGRKEVDAKKIQTHFPEAMKLWKEYRTQPGAGGDSNPDDWGWVLNPNGSIEAWDIGGGTDRIDVYNPKEKRWGNVHYDASVNDDWIDAATGIKGWRDDPDVSKTYLDKPNDDSGIEDF